MEEMRALGAPSLPAELYYHVRSNSMGMAYVAIRKPRKYVWDKTLIEISIRRYDRKTGNILLSPDEAIHDAAHKMYKLWTEKTPEQLWWSDFREWEGDHK